MEAAVRFTWNMLYDCNYRCTYCFFEGKWAEYRKKNVYFSPDELTAFWERANKKNGPIYLHITGAETFLYPNFIEIIKRLSKICCHINISSNSSGDLKSFVEELSPDKVSLSLSFHPQFDDFENFLQRLLFIRQHRFGGCINLVAYPGFLEHIGVYQEKLAKINESLKVIPFFGEYRGKIYPQSYTPQEQRLIGIDESWFVKVKRCGSACQAGQKTALIFPDGKIARCGQTGEQMVLGNFFDPDFNLLPAPLPCAAEYCPCAEGELIPEDPGGTKVTGAGDNLEEKKALEHPAVKESGISFTWDSHYKCNFRCPYCWFYEVWVNEGKRNVYLSVDEWMGHWKRFYDHYGKCHIAITGGEPFLYPNFIPLIKQLSQLHSVKITTNMSGDIETFVKEIDPQKVTLDLNFHPLFSNQELFIKKTLLLKNAGFKAGVCYLAYPPQMKQMETVRKRFAEAGIGFALAAFWGEYQGRRYPESYSQQERDIMRPHLGADVDRITYHLKGESPKGKLCNAGYKYAVIQSDGKVIRCGQLPDAMGNFFDKDFRLFPTAQPCTVDCCPSNEYVNLIPEKENR